MRKQVRETVIKLSDYVEYSFTWFGVYKAKRKTIDMNSEHNDRKINK